jgi:hypothetical protein
VFVVQKLTPLEQLFDERVIVGSVEVEQRGGLLRVSLQAVDGESSEFSVAINKNSRVFL